MPSNQNEIERIKEDLLGEVHKQAKAESAKILILGAIGLLAIAMTGWWLYIQPKLVAVVGGVPKNGVIAVDDPQGCPAGWTNFTDAAGRVIIGVGSGKGLTARAYRDTGGEERHTLTIDEIPSHAHQYERQTDVSGGCGLQGCNSHTEYKPHQTSSVGGGKPHNNMQPFLALYLCKKP